MKGIMGKSKKKRKTGYLCDKIPGPQVPHVNLFPILVVDSFVTAIVAYAVSMSMALILAEGHDYEVDPNQELLAQGIGNLVNSFFSCVTFGASLSRSMVLKQVGGRTQFTGLIASGLIVVVLLWIADFFQPLPRAILASIIIIALRKIMVQIFDLPRFWRLSRWDGIVWVIVFVTVVIIDVDYGLFIGFCFSVGSVFMQGLKAYACLLGNVPNTDLFLDVNRYKAARQYEGIKIIHYRGAINFATRGHFKEEILKLSGMDPKQEQRKRAKRLEEQDLGVVNVGFIGDGVSEFSLPVPEIVFPEVKYIIIDFSAVSNIDPAGAEKIHKLVDEYKNVDVPVVIAACSGQAYEKLDKCGYIHGHNDDGIAIFPTVCDAVHHALTWDNHRL